MRSGRAREERGKKCKVLLSCGEEAGAQKSAIEGDFCGLREGCRRTRMHIYTWKAEARGGCRTVAQAWSESGGLRDEEHSRKKQEKKKESLSISQESRKHKQTQKNMANGKRKGSPDASWTKCSVVVAFCSCWDFVQQSLFLVRLTFLS